MNDARGLTFLKHVRVCLPFVDPWAKYTDVWSQRKRYVSMGYRAVLGTELLSEIGPLSTFCLDTGAIVITIHLHWEIQGETVAAAASLLEEELKSSYSVSILTLGKACWISYESIFSTQGLYRVSPQWAGLTWTGSWYAIQCWSCETCWYCVGT